ncbi:MAG: hypothetical protein HY951_00400 [Bacteroidia bacterium]|nr:hypothetical protein [Bacteroidia bacterium]
MSLIYIGIIIFIAFYFKFKNIQQNSAYNYFVIAIIIKILAGVIFCLIYSIYYPGGDTSSYFNDTVIYNKLLFKSPIHYFKILTGDNSIENYNALVKYSGIPWLDSKDFPGYSTVRFTCIFTLFGFNSFWAATILLAAVSFIPTWKFYLLLSENYPRIKRELAIACLFIPSVLFWGSGILKDTYTHAATLGIFYCAYRIFINNKKIIYYSLLLLIFIYILISIKPYIFFPLAIALFIGYWLFFFNKIKSLFIKTVVFPLLVFFLIITGNILLSFSFNIVGGEYKDINSILNKAAYTQQDLKQTGQSAYDIGKFEKSIPGIIKKFPNAVVAGLNRPFLWEVKNLMMLFSSLENLCILLLIGFVVVFVGPLNRVCSLK